MRLNELKDLQEKSNIPEYELEFGKFTLLIPLQDEEAESMMVSLGAAGMEPYIEQVVHDYPNDEDIMKNATEELKAQMPMVKKALYSQLSNEKVAGEFYFELKEILEWLEGGYKKNLDWNEEVNEWQEKFMGHTKDDLEFMDK